MDWYRLGIKDVFDKLETSEKGLTAAEAGRRLEKEGPNRLPEGKGAGRIEILIHQFKSPLIYILLVAAVVTAFLGEYIDTAVIAAVLILNALIGYIQEFKAEKSMRALQGMVVSNTNVFRNGEEIEIPSEELVPGDIVLLTSGMRVPADLRLFHTTELKIEEAALTGESLPVDKVTSPIDQGGMTPGDQVNMAFMGTIVVSGRAKGIIVATGTRTVLGTIARDMAEMSVTATPLQEKITRFANFIGFLVLGSALAIAILGFLFRMTAGEIFKIAVAASVAAIPEGLPVVVTITMAIGLSRMAKRHAIIRKLPAVETLGSTTVICSDKTGTLTKNEMTVKVVFDGRSSYEVTGSGYAPEGEILCRWECTGERELEKIHPVLRIGMLCNESRIYQENGEFRVSGDPTEGALIVSGMKAGLKYQRQKADYPQLSLIPFESERGFMASLHEHEGRRVIFVKGTPEKIIEMCSGTISGDRLDSGKIMEVGENFAADGMRVLGMAFKETEEGLDKLTEDHIKGGFTFAGLQGMIDPPRQEVVEAVKGCKQAGIRVAMITGDHAVTASAVARMIGITEKDAEVMTGRELETIDDDALFQKVKTVSVFARVSPQHKLRIVNQFKRHGEIVAVTGDGVNDAPALKTAHIGVAMGKTGTDVAREAADMVVTDDNFSSIFHAVEEGRVVFDNIRKVILFLIPTGFAAVLSILTAMLTDMPIPYVAAQLLWINLVTNGLQDVALAFEPAEKNILKRKPRNPQEGVMSRLMIQRSILVGALMSAGIVINFSSALDAGYSLEKARTVAVTTMVLFQFFQAWNCRSEFQSIFHLPPLSNPLLFYGIVASFLAHVAVIYLPSLQWIFRTEALSGSDWGRIALMSLTVVIAVEIDKFIRRRGDSLSRKSSI